MRMLFISYRSSDHREVDYIAKQLRSIKDNNGNTKYTTWQDKHDLIAGKPWWDGITEAIIRCDIFVFHLSPEYLASKVCIAELNYAVERNRPIIPIVLDTAYFINPRSKKPDIDFWDDIPTWLKKYHFLFSNEDNFLDRFENTVAEFERNWPEDVNVRPPLNPDDTSVHGSTFAIYAAATEKAIRLAFDDAKPLFRELVARNDAHFADICRQWLTLLDLYQELLDAKQHRTPRAVFKGLWDAYTSQFPLDFIDDLYPDIEGETIIFDPHNLARKPLERIKKLHPIEQVTFTTTQSEQIDLSHVVPLTEPNRETLMPNPFEWIEISAGSGTMKTYDGVTLQIPTERYWISKYPVTNAQFGMFVNADGYESQEWWTDQGWEHCQGGWFFDEDEGWKSSDIPWSEPYFSRLSRADNSYFPVAGVSWYEASAFCKWLSSMVKKTVELPTEEQWQYAAQGDDSRVYPWGDTWSNSKCNNSVINTLSGIATYSLKYQQRAFGLRTSITSVLTYESMGDSNFGLVDMVGNVNEWCVTKRTSKQSMSSDSADIRILKGGAWNFTRLKYLRCDYRHYADARSRRSHKGFRLVCS